MKAAGVISRSMHRESAVSVINEAGQAPAMGATRGSLLIRVGGGGAGHTVLPNTKAMSEELFVLLTLSEIIPRKTSKLAFTDEEWVQLEGKKQSVSAPRSLPHASSHSATFGFIALDSHGVLVLVQRLPSLSRAKG